MNILYVGAFRFPNRDAAGARVLNNAKIFRALGHNVQFLSWGGNYKESDILADGSYAHDGFPYVITQDLDLSGSLWQKFCKYINRAGKSIKMINEKTPRPDLIIAYNPDFFLTTHLLRYCRKKGIYLANDLTEWYSYDEMPFFERPLYWFNMRCLQKRVRNKILISSKLKDHFGHSNNIKLPPLCDSSDLKWYACVEDHKIGDFDGITFIYAGTPAKKDNIYVAVSAIDRLAKEGAPVRIIVIGITKETYLSHSSSHKCLHDNIIFIGRISQDLVPAYYRCADFMILLRDQNRKNNYGFPTKVAESISAGVPVITNATSDLADYIKDSETGFIIGECSVEAVYRLVKERVLSLDSKKLNQMKNHVHTMKYLFDWPTYKGSVSDFIKDLEQ